MPAKRILVIDDSLIIRRLVTDTLKIGGYDVDTASDGEEGLKKLSAERFDLVIVDLIMPKMDGFRLMQAVKNDKSSQDNPIIVVVALTTEEDERYKKKAIELGAKAYIVKPFRARELLSTIKELL